MQFIMMGTGPFAVPTFRALLESDHRALCLVTRPERPVHNRRRKQPRPMRDLAEQYNIAVHDPEDVNSEPSQALLSDYHPDLLVVCDYGQILSPAVLATARLGGINLHGSLLPKYRGAAPINWAIYHGEPVTGNSVIHMTPGLDAGPILAQCETLVAAQDDAITIEKRLAEMGGTLVVQVIEQLAADNTRALPQDKHLATRARRLRKEDGQIDWTRTAQQIADQVRAFVPWPGTFTYLDHAQQQQRLIVTQVRPLDSQETETVAAEQGKPGEIVFADKRLLVATGDGLLALEQVQPAGKRKMSVEEFLRGHSLRCGDRFQSA